MSLIDVNLFVIFASSASFEPLAVTSAIEDNPSSNIAAASMFLALEKALDAFLNIGVNILNACADSAATALLAASDAAPLPSAAPVAPITPLAILPLTIAPTAYPLFFISLSNKKLVVIQLSVEYQVASFSISE